MDTNLIDSCREATGETTKPGNDVTGDFRAFKTNGDQMVERLTPSPKIISNVLLNFRFISIHLDHRDLYQQIHVDSEDGYAKWKQTFQRCLQSLKP